MADGGAPYWGAFACPKSVALGSVVELRGAARARAEKLGLPVSGVCADRFAERYSAGHLDICIPQRHRGMTNEARLRWAMTWGRVSGEVVIREITVSVRRQ